MGLVCIGLAYEKNKFLYYLYQPDSYIGMPTSWFTILNTELNLGEIDKLTGNLKENVESVWKSCRENRLKILSQLFRNNLSILVDVGQNQWHNCKTHC